MAIGPGNLNAAPSSDWRWGDVLEGADGLSSVILDALKERLGDRIEEYVFPPPVFAAMQGACVGLDLDAGALTTQFPVLESYLNPYGTVQGGMLAAAVDNTLGPLSMLVEAPNVTRQLEMTYNRPVTLDIGYILVEARLLERRDRRLFFRAVVRNPDGLQLARARAVHWIIREEDMTP
jgi:acyl-coenzyme A thioesterase PaaI-like protein